MMKWIHISVTAYRGTASERAKIRVTGYHTDGSADSFVYPLPDPRCLDVENVDDWAKELLIQAIEQL